MTARVDTDLPLSSPTAPPGPVGDAASALTLAGHARAHLYVLEGERVVVRGEERSGAAEVYVDGALVLGELGCEAGTGVNVVVSPSFLRRECIGPRGTVMESVLALPTLPMAAFQWDAPERLELSFTILPGQDGVRFHPGDRSVRVQEDAGDAGVEVLLHPEPEEWHVAAGDGGGVRVRARVGASGPATLLVATGSPEATRRALDAGRHLGAHAIRSATDQDPSNAEGLLPRTGVPELDQGVGWAAVRLAGALRRGEPVGPGDWFWSGVGALASGNPRGALLGAEGVRRISDVTVGGDTPAPGAALWAFLTARATLLSGHEAPAQRALEALDPETLDEARQASSPGAWAWWRLALTTLADALRYGASEDEIRRLRAAAALPGRQTTRALPMVGAGPEPGSAPWLAALLRGEGLGRSSAAESSAALAPLSALASGDVDGGYAAWRRTLAQGLEGQAGPRGSWDPTGRGPALVLATLAFGLLGLEPDAPSGRIRCAPVLPGHLENFRIEGIRVGEARFRLTYQRRERTHRFELTPREGRVPPEVVLEPSLPCVAVGAARVDGGPADLESEPHQAAGPRTRVRVQIPLDGPRLLEIEEG